MRSNKVNIRNIPDHLTKSDIKGKKPGSDQNHALDEQKSVKIPKDGIKRKQSKQ